MNNIDWGSLVTAVVALITAIVGILNSRKASAQHAVNSAKIAELQAKSGDPSAVPPQR